MGLATRSADRHHRHLHDKGAVRDLGKALSLPPEEVDQLAKQSITVTPATCSRRCKNRAFQEKITPRWAGFDPFCPPNWMAFRNTWGASRRHDYILHAINRYRACRPGAIDGRYVCQWDKDSIDDAVSSKSTFWRWARFPNCRKRLK